MARGAENWVSKASCSVGVSVECSEGTWLALPNSEWGKLPSLHQTSIAVFWREMQSRIDHIQAKVLRITLWYVNATNKWNVNFTASLILHTPSRCKTKLPMTINTSSKRQIKSPYSLLSVFGEGKLPKRKREEEI